jgi:ribosomal protein S12 methylthiotransferase accessory factor
VSGDYTRHGDPRLDRTSNGVGAHFDADGAILKALLELVERDAYGAWRTSPLESRSCSQVQAASIPFDWFGDLYARARGAGVSFSVYAIPAVVPLPVFACEMFERGAGSVLRRRVGGYGCGLTAEAAVLAAVLEAAQSRLTVISGARDDLPDPWEASRMDFGPALPPSADTPLTIWAEIADADPDVSLAGVAGLSQALARAGYPQIGLVDITRPGGQARVVKAFVPGLGAFARARRSPASALA